MRRFISPAFWTILILLTFFAADNGIFSLRSALGVSLLGDMIRSAPWEKADEGIEHRYVKANTDTNENKGLRMVRMSQSIVRPGVLFARDFGASSMTVKEIAEKSGAIAAINASYFDECDRPLGYLKVSGREVNDYIATPLIYSGIFAIGDGKASILHRDKFQAPDFEEALQVGPRLIADGAYTKGLQNMIDYKEPARRAGIAIDRKGRFVLFITSPPLAEMNWNELRAILIGPEKNGGINPMDAMNLDGGSSTQLYVKAGKLTINEGYARVPVAIGFFRR